MAAVTTAASTIADAIPRAPVPGGCQAQRSHLDLFAAVGGDVPAAAVADHRVAAVPGLHDVQALFDLPLPAAVARAAGDEVTLLRPGNANLAQGLPIPDAA